MATYTITDRDCIDALLPEAQLPAFRLPTGAVRKPRIENKLVQADKSFASGTEPCAYVARLCGEVFASRIRKATGLLLGKGATGDVWVSIDFVMETSKSQMAFNGNLAVAISAAVRARQLIAFVGKTPSSSAQYGNSVFIDGAWMVRLDPSSPEYARYDRDSAAFMKDLGFVASTGEGAAAGSLPEAAATAMPMTADIATAMWQSASQAAEVVSPAIAAGAYHSAAVQLCYADDNSMEGKSILPCVVIVGANAAPAFLDADPLLQKLPACHDMGITVAALDNNTAATVVDLTQRAFQADVTVEPAGPFLRITAWSPVV